MSADKEHDKPSENREARPSAGKAEPAPEPASTASAGKDGSEFRETPEGGYGWGV